MFTDFIVNILLMAGLPFLLNIYISNKNRKAEDRIIRPKTRADRIVSVALCLALVYEVYNMFFYHPNSIFRTLNIPTNSPNWLFQNRFREYLSSTYGQEFASLDVNHIRPNQVNQDKYVEIRDLAKLFNELKNPEKRGLYLKYGEEAYTQCTWCERDGDYLLFAFSRTSLHYIYMLALLGAVTSTTRKDMWRFWSVILISSTVLVEIFMYITPQDGNFLEQSLYEKIHFIRTAVFAVILLLVWIFDKSDEKTNEEIIAEMMGRTEVMINRAQAHEINTVSVLLDSTLRKKFIRYYEQKEAEKSAIYTSPEYNDVRLQVISKYNLEKMIEESYTMSENIVNNFKTLVQKRNPQNAPNFSNTTKTKSTSSSNVNSNTSSTQANPNEQYKSSSSNIHSSNSTSNKTFSTVNSTTSSSANHSSSTTSSSTNVENKSKLNKNSVNSHDHSVNNESSSNEKKKE